MRTWPHLVGGTGREVTALLVSGLRALGVDGEVLDRLATAPVLGGGVPVGEVRPVAG